MAFVYAEQKPLVIVGSFVLPFVAVAIALPFKVSIGEETGLRAILTPCLLFAGRYRLQTLCHLVHYW